MKGLGTSGSPPLSITAWSCWAAAAKVEEGEADVWLLQEHKLVSDAEVDKAKQELSRRGMAGVFSRGITTDAGGRSSGTAVIFGHHVDALGEVLAPGKLRHRATGVRLRVRGRELLLWSLYGHDRDDAITQQLIKDVARVSSPCLPTVIGADFNAVPQQVASWVEDLPSLADCETVSAGGPTCLVGTATSEIDFFVCSRPVLNAFREVEVVQSAVPTHSAVVITIASAGAQPLLEWVRAKIPELSKGLRAGAAQVLAAGSFSSLRGFLP